MSTHILQWVVQWVREFAPQREGWVVLSQLRKTEVIKTGNDSSTVKSSAIGASVKGHLPRVIGDDHYMRMLLVGVTRKRNLAV